MTGRPSGRCAATEALAVLLDYVERDRGGGPTTHIDYYAIRDHARAALASPCCVSAADQEQVREALLLLDEAAQAWPRPNRYSEAARDALALLSSNEEERGPCEFCQGHGDIWTSWGGPRPVQCGHCHGTGKASIVGEEIRDA